MRYSILIIGYYARGCKSSLLEYQVCSLSVLHPLGVGSTQFGQGNSHADLIS